MADKVKFGIIGTGAIAAMHAEALRDAYNAELVAVYDQVTERAQQFAEKFGVRAAADFESDEVYDFVANVGLYTHDQYESRKKRGKELDTENLDADDLNKKIKQAKQKEKLTDAGQSLFGRIFGKKK